MTCSSVLAGQLFGWLARKARGLSGLLTLGNAGSFVNILEKSALRPGVRPICQATKLLDRDPIVRRMAEQDLLVMGRATKPYLDQVRAVARPKLQ